LVGTFVVIFVSDPTVKTAEMPLNFTAAAPVNPVPVRETAVPTLPASGENPVSVGADAGVRGDPEHSVVACAFAAVVADCSTVASTAAAIASVVKRERSLILRISSPDPWRDARAAQGRR
jgi:hypothetical protein